MQLCRHCWKCSLKKWEWVPEENELKESHIEVEKDFTKKELKELLREDKQAIIGYFILGLILGCIGFISKSWIFGLCSIGITSIVTTAIGLLQYYIDHYAGEYSYYLGSQGEFGEEKRLTLIFAEEIAQLYEEKKQQEELAAKWRKRHPLEEKIRLALTMNPNYIADLLRYCELVKPNKTSEKQRIKREQKEREEAIANQAIKVMYIDN